MIPHVPVITTLASRPRAQVFDTPGCWSAAIVPLSYNSCRDRHCPKCQSQARDRWLNARRAELLATPYAHVVFTLPHLPRGFVRIRHFGFLASRRRGALVPLCKLALSANLPETPNPASSHSDTRSHTAPLWTCPLCGGPMVVI
jgi:hypothetical protein